MVGIWATHCTNAHWLKSTKNCLKYSAVGKPKILKPENKATVLKIAGNQP